MDQPSPSSFEKEIESDIAKLAVEIKNRREGIAVQNYNERELLKEAIRAFPNLEKTPATAPISAPASAPASAPVPASATMSSVLPEYAQSAPPEVKLEIEYLLDTAFRHGIGKALAESERSSYFVQDAFHDALAGRLYPELQKRGIVK